MRLKIVIVLLLATVVLATRGEAATAPALTERIPEYLTASGYTFTQHNQSVWSIAKTSKSLGDFKVVIGTQEDLVVIFVTVARKKNMRLTPEFMETLLKLNHKLDHVKIAFDTDGDLSVRTDCKGRVLDAQELKEQIEQVAASAIEIYDASRPYLSQ